MSSKPTIDPSAVKKRGRPKKVVAEDVGTAPDVAASKAAVNKVAAKTSGREKVLEVQKEKKVVAKSGKTASTATATTATTAGKKNAPQSTTIAPEQPTPITPSTSKILEAVEAKGTLKKTQHPAKAIDKEVSANAQDKTKAKPSQPPWSSPPKPPFPQSKPAPPPHPSIPNKPSTTSPRTTTIPLPSKPSLAPSPIPSPKPTTTTRPPQNPYPSIRPSPSQPYSHPHTRSLPPSSSPYQRQHPTRIIEPTPDIRLPPKYKPAARRVTAIIVGLPIVFVVGYELFERWRGKDVRRKFVEDREVLRGIDERREGGL